MKTAHCEEKVSGAKLGFLGKPGFPSNNLHPLDVLVHGATTQEVWIFWSIEECCEC